MYDSVSRQRFHAMDSIVAASCVITTSWDTEAASRNRTDATRLEQMWWQYVEYEINVLMWAALVIVTWVLMKRLWNLGTLWLKASRLPGPPISHFARHANVDNYTEYFRALHKEYGPIVRVWLGPTRPLVSIKDRNMVRELLVRARDRDLRTCKTMERAFGRGSVSAARYSQARVKRLPLYEKVDGKLSESLHPAAARAVGLLKRWVEPGEGGLMFDRKVVSDHLCFTSVGLIYFGEAFLHWPGADEFEGLMAVICNETHLWGKFNVVPVWNKEFRDFMKKCTRLQALTEEIIHLSRHQKSNAKENHNEIPCYLEELDEFVSTGGGKEVCHGTIWNLLSGGAGNLFGMSEDDVTGHLLAIICHTWTATSTVTSDLLLRLARYPGVQFKAHAEIDHLCKGRAPSSADVRQMHYLKAVLYESTRLDPCAPLITRCSLDSDLQMADSVLPSGAVLSIPVQALHTDTEELGQDAYEFRPERFLKNSNVDPNLNASVLYHENSSLTSESLICGSVQQSDYPVKGNCPVFKLPDVNNVYLTFGAGARPCPGQGVATGLMLSLVSLILQQYDVKLESKDEVTPKSTLFLVPRR